MIARFYTLLSIFALIVACITAVPFPVDDPSQGQPAACTTTYSEIQACASNLCQYVSDFMNCTAALGYINEAIPLYNLTTKPLRAVFISNIIYQTTFFREYDKRTEQPSRAGPFMLTNDQTKLFVDSNQTLINLADTYVKSGSATPYLDFILNMKNFGIDAAAWWTIHGPGCVESFQALDGSWMTFKAWAEACIGTGSGSVLYLQSMHYSTVMNSIH
ncbi:hypothetical protein BGX24_008582 [Mortierella sp. AD032]|nr:hypothetical protein BGX24_008582 [Mortierella sp. AD032]